ncbi:hypothetical protein PYW07_011664 [Mythimna separata]|uniref:Uncharacterized protein n=1 Tax=Mythimna separata TaxID=271217 RepID=A0AAD7Y6I9_MYTSE|nr:hypothetical protein PYW07_011664 [Mythimna separata]
MAAKAFFVFCASALLVQTISGQAIGACNSIAGATLAAEELALAANTHAYGCNQAAPWGNSYGLAANSFAPSSGGGFLVQSISPIAPTGITVFSENAIEGALAVNGELPFLSAVTVEGALPSSGAGGINYGCGSGAVGIVSEGVGAAATGPYGAIAPAAAMAPGRVVGLSAPAGLSLGAPMGFTGLAAPSCGCKGSF